VSAPLLIDTNILIDYLRQKEEARGFLEGLQETPLISALTVAELYAGVREGEERQRTEVFLGTFEVVPVTQELAQQGGLFRRDYAPKHGTDLADGIIAATVKDRKARLATLNDRHFPMLSNVLVPYGKGKPRRST
jgi:predicted nucleic acid-binding protein